MRLDGFGLFVDDMASMIRFYRDALGFEIKEGEDSRLTESGVELRLREMGKKLGIEKYTHISSEGLWQQERLRRVCQLNRCRRYWDMNR